ncbi:MAG TPA: hypothetical protein VFZ08_06410 [Terriglobia bacterium]|nr:hypothetical protein [Terriglobia bacterium]
MAAFPADTQQISYANLAQLRTLPDYGQLRRLLFSVQMQNFEQFLRPLGTDPEKDVDEVALGWRGGNHSAFFGLAQGRFNPAQAQAYVTKEQLPTSEYQGFTLDAFGSGLGRDDLFFTFLNSNLAAFGRLSDLKAVIDGYLGRRATLDSDAEFVNWEAALEGSGPQWGVTTGKAAANLAVPWLVGAKPQQKSDLSTLLAPVKAVLYETNWNTDFSANITVVCRDAQSAQTLAQLLMICRDSPAFTNSRPPDVLNFIQGLRIASSGNRVELAGSGSPGVLNRFLRNLNGR